MNKKLLTAAIGAALVAAPMFAANAAPTVYGRLHVSVDTFDNGGSGAEDAAGNKASGWNVASNSSRFGIKGADDLGGGLKGIYQVELGFNADEATSISQRNSYAGLSGGWGTALAGRHDTPYKISTGKLDPFSETVGDYNGIISSVNGTNLFDLRVNNAIAYISPNFSGFSFAAAYTQGPDAPVCAPPNGCPTGGTVAAQANGADQQDVTAMSAFVMYDKAPFFVSVAYEAHNVDDAVLADASRDGLKVGLGFSSDMFGVGLVYETLSADSSTSNINRDAYWGTAWFKLGGNDKLAVAYGVANDSDNAADDKAALMTAGWFHSFSKTSTFYLVYANMANDGAAATYQLGTSGHGDLVKAIAGEDQSSISAGLIMDF
jgi:predicted porin